MILAKRRKRASTNAILFPGRVHDFEGRNVMQSHLHPLTLLSCSRTSIEAQKTMGMCSLLSDSYVLRRNRTTFGSLTFSKGSSPARCRTFSTLFIVGLLAGIISVKLARNYGSSWRRLHAAVIPDPPLEPTRFSQAEKHDEAPRHYAPLRHYAPSTRHGK